MVTSTNYLYLVVLYDHFTFSIYCSFMSSHPPCTNGAVMTLPCTPQTQFSFSLPVNSKFNLLLLTKYFQITLQNFFSTNIPYIALPIIIVCDIYQNMFLFHFFRFIMILDFSTNQHYRSLLFALLTRTYFFQLLNIHLTLMKFTIQFCMQHFS